MALGRPKKPRSDPDANTDTHGATTGYEAELWQMADAFEERRALLESEREGVLVQIEPFPVGKQGEETASTPPVRQRGLDLFTQLFNERIAPSPRVPVERKIFMNLNEAADLEIPERDLPAGDA